jgi:prepilin-type N-terminal cleavage/methylation domain-containing protein
MRMRRREDGFTLIELLIAIVIIGIISLPLGNAVESYFINTSTTTARLNASHDAQIAAAYWQQDAASLGVRSSTYNESTKTFDLQPSMNLAFPCSLPAGSTKLVVLAWNQYDTDGNATTIKVAYATSGTKLLRLQCTNSTPGDTTTLTHYLSATPLCSADGGAFGTCTLITGTPDSLSLMLTIQDPSGKDQPFPLTLNGQRRQTS